MRRILLLPLLFIALFTFLPNQKAYSQTTELFCEDFDSLGINGFLMDRLVVPASGLVLFEKDSIVRKGSSGFSATDTIGNRTTSYLVSPKVGIANFDQVSVTFDQICYIEQFDEAIVEVSFDNGPWFRVPGSINNLGSNERVHTGSFYLPTFAFSKISSPQWPNNDSFFVYNRLNSVNAWVTETFEMGPVINRESRNNNGVFPDTMQIRLGLRDNPSSPSGTIGTHRWWVDNFCIRGANCQDVSPPNLVLDDPPVNYVSRYEDRVYWLGPYDFNAAISDPSTIDSAFIEYYIKRDTSGIPQSTAPRALVFKDTLSMNFLGFTRYEKDIPSAFTNFLTNSPDVITPGDSVYWRLEAIDGSPCTNSIQDPPSGFTAFEVRGNLPKSCGTQPIFNFPYYQTFNGPNFVVSTSGVLAENWVNAEGDFHDFYVGTGLGPDYPNTGPSDDLPGGGKYLYLEATGFRDSIAYLISPCIDLSEEPNNLLRFYLNQNGVGGDTLHLDVFDPTPVLPNFPDGRFINDVIPPIGGNKGDIWLPYEFGTFQFQNKVVQFRFRASPASASENSDIGFDSVKIIPAPIHDLRMDRVILGQYVPAGDPDEVTINVQNVGAIPSDTFDVYYEVLDANGVSITGAQGPFGRNDVIQPGTNFTFTIPGTTYLPPLGLYTVRAWLTYYRDEVASNNETQANSRGLNYRTIDCSKEFFDEDTLWVGLANDTATFSNRWEIGTPNFDRTNSAFTEPNSWDVLLNRGYSGSGSVEQLITQFYDTRGADSVIISFMNNRAMELTKDGVFIEYSLDRGDSWEYLDNPADTVPGDTVIGKRWYNSFLSAGGFGGQFCLSDTTRHMENNWNNWVESELLLPDELENQAELLFRFIFFAEEVPGGSAGMSIDNFLLYDQRGVDLESQYILRPLTKCDLTPTQPFRAVIKNRGAVAVNSFDITYIVDGPGPNQRQIATETINRTIDPRDTIHIFTSGPRFDMSQFGYYRVATVVNAAGDNCIANDTLWQEVENIEGCSFVFEAITNFWTRRTTALDSSFWRFDITNGNDKYVITDDYREFDPADTNRVNICIKDGSQVRFNLGDADTAISRYSFIAFDGENDTVFVDSELGGASPPKLFDWNCPPERSAELLDIILTNNFPLPVEDLYTYDVRWRNDGLDSINFIDVGLQIDRGPVQVIRQVINDVINPPLDGGLQYTRRRITSFDPDTLKPGEHTIMAWVNNPNGLPDLLPENDTLIKVFTVIDTSVVSTISQLDSNGNVISDGRGYCTTFEDTAQIKWVSYNPYPNSGNIAQNQDGEETFVRVTPRKNLINSAISGNKVWMTRDSANYRNVDSAGLLSPFFRISMDSCYKVSFWSNYVIRDQFNDGAQFQVSANRGRGWSTIFYDERDSVIIDDTSLAMTGSFQKNWHNANNIKAIPNNALNSGWTGNSNGWIFSENVFGGFANSITNPFGISTNPDVPPIEFIGNSNQYFAVFHFRFESDATVTDEGFAIDNFCLETIDPDICAPVGLEDQFGEIAEDQVYVGQNVPNPAELSTSIPYFLPQSSEVGLRVVNLTGQLMFEQAITKMNQGVGNMELDVSNYAQGIYFYTFNIDGKNYTRKMVINK